MSSDLESMLSFSEPSVSKGMNIMLYQQPAKLGEIFFSRFFRVNVRNSKKSIVIEKNQRGAKLEKSMNITRGSAAKTSC
jgi:hypothetical protein